ncbi:MAG: uroporphyrinogen decarboxylase, partial [Actinobacteria bacterium]|nr:uroporphyrinogen decarboxylase [Actinomycetota bacterium]
RVEGLKEEVKDWYENTDYCITATAPCSGLPWDFCGYLRGQENFLIDLYLNQKFAQKLLDKVSDIIAEFYVFYVKPISQYVDWVEFESDYSSQENLFIPREKYVQFIKKPNEKVFNAVKKVASDIKLFLHSCGAVKDLIPEFINSGVDILNSLQPSARGMNSFKLKKEFGNDLVFHGGIDIQGPICGSINKAIDEVKTRIKAFATGGGYIFGPTNHFQPDTPVNNFLAIYETAREFGRYPINIKNL